MADNSWKEVLEYIFPEDQKEQLESPACTRPRVPVRGRHYSESTEACLAGITSGPGDFANVQGKALTGFRSAFHLIHKHKQRVEKIEIQHTICR